MRCNGSKFKIPYLPFKLYWLYPLFHPFKYSTIPLYNNLMKIEIKSSQLFSNFLFYNTIYISEINEIIAHSLMISQQNHYDKFLRLYDRSLAKKSC
jgi:hypothetical protein